MRRYVIPIALVVLLAGELLGLTVAFDSQKLDSVHTLWAELVGWSPQVLRLASSIGVAAVALAVMNRPTAIRAARWRRSLSVHMPTVAVHGLSLALFAWITSAIFAVGPAYRAHPELLSVAWILSGVVMMAAWALLLLPLDGWQELVGQTRASVLAGVVIGWLGWASGFVTQEFWTPLSRYTFAVVDWMLRLFYPRTVSVPSSLVVGTPAFRVRITPQCSGYEGIGLILVFLGIYLWLCRREMRFPSALMLLPIGAVVIWLANALRIVALIAIGSAGWRAVASGGFHSQAGWIAFNLIALTFVAMMNRGDYFRRSIEPAAQRAQSQPGQDGEEATAYLGPFIVISATAMVTGLFSSGFDWLYPVRVVTVGAFVWVFRKRYASLRPSWSWWSLACGALTFVVWVALTPRAAADAGWPAALSSMPLGWAAGWLFFRIVGYIVMAPLAEELAFRGFLTRLLARGDFHELPLGTFLWAFLMSSVLFGALHGARWLPATLAGMSFALALYRRGVLGEAVWAHATTNGLLAVYAYATRQWSVWS